MKRGRVSINARKTLSKGQNKSVCERALMITELVIKKQGHFKVHYGQKTLKFSADQRVIYVWRAVEVDLQIVGIDFKIQYQPERENKAAGSGILTKQDKVCLLRRENN